MPYGNLPQRIPPPADRTIGSQVGQEALNVVGRFYSLDQTAERSKLPKHKQWDYDRRIRDREEIALIRWLWENPQYRLNEVDFTRKWKEQGEIQGAEHEVYAEEGFVYKRNNLAYHTTWLQFFDRVALHNWLFPNTRLELIGFMDVLGDLRPVSKQRIVEGIRGATREEVTREMQQLGLTELKMMSTLTESVVF